MGRLKVGTSAHIGSYVLPQVIPLFNRTYPNIEVSISEGSSQVPEHMISGSELDAALMHLPLRDVRANYAEIARERYVMAFSRNHPLSEKLYYKEGAHYPYIDPREAAGEKFVLSFPYQRVRQISDRILKNAGITPDIILTTSCSAAPMILFSVIWKTSMRPSGPLWQPILWMWLYPGLRRRLSG